MHLAVCVRVGVGVLSVPVVCMCARVCARVCVCVCRCVLYATTSTTHTRTRAHTQGAAHCDGASSFFRVGAWDDMDDGSSIDIDDEVDISQLADELTMDGPEVVALRALEEPREQSAGYARQVAGRDGHPLGPHRESVETLRRDLLAQKRPVAGTPLS